MEQLSLGVCGTSRKENEHRLPIHPLHLDRIEAGLRAGSSSARLRRAVWHS